MSEALGAGHLRHAARSELPRRRRRALVDRNFSEQTGQQIDAEVRKIVEEQHVRTTRIVGERRALLDALTGQLLVDETLDERALNDLVAEYTPKAAE